MGINGFTGKPAAAALAMVITERDRQIDTGRTPERDALYHQCELSRAAAAYATPAGWRRHNGDGVPTMWPWHPSTFIAEPQTAEGRLRELAKAGALILAEMERIIAKAQP